MSPRDAIRQTFILVQPLRIAFSPLCLASRSEFYDNPREQDPPQQSLPDPEFLFEHSSPKLIYYYDSFPSDAPSRPQKHHLKWHLKRTQ